MRLVSYLVCCELVPLTWLVGFCYASFRCNLACVLIGYFAFVLAFGYCWLREQYDDVLDDFYSCVSCAYCTGMVVSLRKVFITVEGCFGSMLAVDYGLYITLFVFSELPVLLSLHEGCTVHIFCFEMVLKLLECNVVCILHYCYFCYEVLVGLIVTRLTIAIKTVFMWLYSFVGSFAINFNCKPECRLRVMCFSHVYTLETGGLVHSYNMLFRLLLCECISILWCCVQLITVVLNVLGALTVVWFCRLNSFACGIIVVLLLCTLILVWFRRQLFLTCKGLWFVHPYVTCIGGFVDVVVARLLLCNGFICVDLSVRSLCSRFKLYFYGLGLWLLLQFLFILVSCYYDGVMAGRRKIWCLVFWVFTWAFNWMMFTWLVVVNLSSGYVARMVTVLRLLP
eukprot:gene3393-2347_t